MELLVFVGLLVVGILVVPALFLTSIPETSKSDEDDFAKSLPDGFGYPYYLDGSGYGINVLEGKIFIQSSYHKKKIYDRSSIREIEWKLEGADKYKLHGTANPLKHMHTGLDNRKLKKQAYEASGIFIQTADIDNPMWQIKYSSEQEIRRSAEILKQFLNGELIDYQEYVKQQGVGSKQWKMPKYH